MFPLLLLCLLLLLARFFSTQLLTAAASGLVEDDGPPRRANAIVVLGGDGYGDRTLKGAELAKAGYAPLVYVSSPPKLVGDDADDQVRFAEQHGYPADFFREVHLPREAESTRTETQYLGKYLRDRGIKSILLVTSNFHTRRAAKLWREINPTLTITVIGSVDPWGYFTPNGWWKTRPGQKLFLFEWLKTISAMFGV